MTSNHWSPWGFLLFPNGDAFLLCQMLLELKLCGKKNCEHLITHVMYVGRHVISLQQCLLLATL